MLLFLPMSLTAAETAYKIVHPDGTVEFTDDPNRGGDAIQLKEAPTFKAPPVPISTPTPPSKPEQEKGQDVAIYNAISITSPVKAQTLWFDGTGVDVTLEIDPGLSGSDQVVIELDGKEVARGQETQYTLNDVFRGEHQLSASIVDAQGNTRLQSEPVIFYMQRHTINNPAVKP